MRSWLDILRGSVRPAVTYALCGALIWGFVVGLVGADVFVPIAASVVGFWFASRQQTVPHG